MLSQKRKVLRQLTREWDIILAATGFKDIERTIGESRILIQNSANAFRQADELTRETKIRYYDIIAEKVHTSAFQNPTEKWIMRKISEGAKIKEIVEELRLRGHSIHRQTIRYIVRRYENAWGIKAWSYRQMNLKPPTE